MRAAVTQAPSVLRLAELPDPGSLGPGQVMVRPEVVGICGSDLHAYAGDLGATPTSYPRVQGHELSAVVEEVGPACPDAPDVGDRVAVWPLTPCSRCYACRIGRPNVCAKFELVGVHVDGGLQERLVVRADQVFAVGDLDSAVAALAEPMSIAVHAVRRAGIADGERVVVFGAGPIGITTAMAAQERNAQVMLLEPVPARRELAGRIVSGRVWWGEPDEIAAVVGDWTDGDGPAVVMDTTGVPSVLAQAAELAARGGRIVVVGLSGALGTLRPGILPEKELDVLGTSCCDAYDFAEAVRVVRSDPAAILRLVTHRFPLARTAEALELALHSPEQVMKVLVDVTGS